MIESCIVIVFLCLLFLGLFQLVHAFVAREVLFHAAARAARAKTVGFNRWMVEKTMRVAAIPNAGRLVMPVIPGGDPALGDALATLQPGELWDFALQSTPRSATIDTELARIPEYLASANSPRAGNILDYENWDSIAYNISSSAGVVIDPSSPGTFTARVTQPHDLLVAIADLLNGDIGADSPGQTNRITLIGRYDVEAHCPLYLDADRNW
ncbi:MAG: hypothetical protein WCI17_05835 [bacterium]